MSLAAKAKSKAISPPPTKRRRLPSPPKALAISAPPRPIQPLQPDQFRIIAWNINGISPFLQPSIKSFFSPTKRSQPESSSARPEPAPTPTFFHDCFKRWRFPQILCLQEVHISPTDTATQRAVQKSVEHGEKAKGYTAHFSLPRDKYNAKGLRGQRKVHGVCTFLRNDIAGTCVTTSPEWDLEGRVLVSRFPDLHLVVINVYAPNGTLLPYYSPATGLEAGTRHDFKRTFHTSLASLVSHHQKADARCTVVVCGDLNIARHAVDGFPNHRQGVDHVESRRDFERKFMDRVTGLGMRDTFREVWGQEQKFSYRPRNVEWGQNGDRVDLILMSRSDSEELGQNDEAASPGKGLEAFHKSELIEADILDDEGERGPSDHVPHYVTLSIQARLANLPGSPQ